MTPAVTPQTPQAQERTADNPNPLSPKESLEAVGVTETDKSNLLLIKRRYEEEWLQQHRAIVKNTLRIMEYFKGNQYISFDPQNFRYYDPFDKTSAGSGSEQGNDQDYYKYVTNIIQWLTRILVASLSTGIPATRFWPANAERDEDIKAAQQASEAEQYIEQQNNIAALLKQEVLYLAVAGCYFKQTRFMRDADRTGTRQEPVWMESQENLWEDHYSCPACGAETPADLKTAMGAPKCVQCGKELSDADFYPAETVSVPKQVGSEEVPNGQVVWSLHHGLDVSVAPDANESSTDPLMNTPMLKKDREVDIAAVRASYPKSWDELGKQSGSGVSDDIDRVSRERSQMPQGSWGRSIASQKPTLSQVWLQPWAFNKLDEQKDADSLRQKFSKGCMFVCVGDLVLEVIPAKLSDEWTWCGTIKGFGAYPPAILAPAMDFQDKLNDTCNTIQEYADRVASPGALIDADLLNANALNGKALGPGSLTPVKINRAKGEQLSNSFFQLKFEIDGRLYQLPNDLLQLVQLLIGTLPQTYGGHQDGVDTASGQKQALDVASSILALYLDNIREEHANAAKRAVKCLAENATDDLTRVVESDSEGRYANHAIKIDDLKGEFNVRPETDAGYPESYAQRTKRLQEMIEAAKQNPLIMEMFQPRRNRRQALLHMGVPGLELPDEGQYKKVMADIDNLLQGAPGPWQDPATGMVTQLPMGPTGPIVPDKILDDLKTNQDILLQWAWENYEVAQQNPNGWANVRMYAELLGEYQQQKALAAMPPPPAAGGESTAGAQAQ